MAKTHLATVRKVLREYADRGVFGGFSETQLPRGKTEFAFQWFHNRRYALVFDEPRATLKFKDFLPYLPADSDLYRGLKTFVKSRSDNALPAHRRIDSKRADAKCQNRGACASVSITVKNNQYAYGTRKLVNLVHEAFLMINEQFTEYLYEHFDLPEE